AMDPAREKDFAAFVQAGRVDGVLLMHGRLLPVSRGRKAQVPTVGLCERVPGSAVPYVATTNRVAARAMSDYLIALGHRRIAYVGGPRDNVVET
ncbi:hypothetical protein KC218_22595, partial [Mycobacterium tuberculosis]|nr:hypothetical protein [Mycobacterium tuberculosis]